MLPAPTRKVLRMVFESPSIPHLNKKNFDGLNLSMAKTVNNMIVHHANSLHMGI